MRLQALGAAASAAVALSAASVQAQPAAAPAPVPSRVVADPMAMWSKPAEPYRIAGNLYYVGAADPTAYLIDTGKGLILLDVGVAPYAPKVLANIRALGFDPKNVRIILNSHAHLDHAGGLAEVKAATGAKLYAMAEDAPILEVGGKDDPDVRPLGGFPPVKVDHQLKDGEKVTLGSVTLTANRTAGHTPGCTTWTLPITVDGQPHTATFICSLTILGPAPVNAARAALWRATYAKLDKLPCDLFFASHQSMYDGERKHAAQAPGKPNPFIDPAGCKAFIASHKAEFETKFAKVGG